METTRVPGRTHLAVIRFNSRQIRIMAFCDAGGELDASNADGWLAPDVQAELDAMTDQMNTFYDLLRAARNLVTHDSAESRSRMKHALGKAAHVDSEFAYNQPVTELNIVRWISSNSQS